jgi:hypothetical protein
MIQAYLLRMQAAIGFASGWVYPLKYFMILNVWLFSLWVFVFQVLARLATFRHVPSAHLLGVKN